MAMDDSGFPKPGPDSGFRPYWLLRVVSWVSALALCGLGGWLLIGLVSRGQ